MSSSGSIHWQLEGVECRTGIPIGSSTKVNIRIQFLSTCDIELSSKYPGRINQFIKKCTTYELRDCYPLRRSIFPTYFKLHLLLKLRNRWIWGFFSPPQKSNLGFHRCHGCHAQWMRWIPPGHGRKYRRQNLWGKMDGSKFVRKDSTDRWTDPWTSVGDLKKLM